MIVGRLGGDLEANWARDDSSVAHRSAWPIYRGTGAEDSAVTYFEIDPGKRIGAHHHDTGETILLLEGEARAVVGEDEATITPGTVVHVPARARHDVVNAGETPLRLAGFFAKAEVVTVFEQEQMPDGTHELGTPD